MADKFSVATKKVLEDAACSICSFPGCRLLTRFIPVGRKSRKSVNIGEGAHITAASKGGPRFDASMTSKQRSSASNGIWMCCNHAHYIDVAVDVVTTPMLRAWKKQHEDAVKAGIITKLTARSHQYARRVESVVVNGFGMKPGARFTLGRVNFVEECGKLSADIIWKLMCFFSRGFMADLSSKVSKRSYSIEISIRDGDVPRTLKRFWPGNDDSKAYNCDVLNDLMRVKSFFNAILIDVIYSGSVISKRHVHSESKRFVDAIANMIGISYKQTYEILETLFPLVTMVGYCFRFAETKEKFPDIEVKTSENNFYLEFAQLSYSEQLLARIDLALRFIMSMAPNQYWLMILGSEVMSKLNEDTRLRQVIFGLPDNIQVFCCVAGKDIVDFMISGKENVFNVTDCNEFKIYSSTEDLDANFFAGG